MTADLAVIPVLDGRLEIPAAVLIPPDVDTMVRRLAALDGLATAAEWARAAIVAAYVVAGDSQAHIDRHVTPLAEGAAS